MDSVQTIQWDYPSVQSNPKLVDTSTSMLALCPDILMVTLSVRKDYLYIEWYKLRQNYS